MFPIFTGMTRSPMYLGVPVVPLTAMWMVIAVPALNWNIFFAVIGIILWPVMALIYRWDEHAFRRIGLWLLTKVRNIHSAKLWGGVSYSPKGW